MRKRGSTSVAMGNAHPEFPLIFPETVATIQCHYKFIFTYLKCEDNYNFIWL